jgi:hypothetical protein
LFTLLKEYEGQMEGKAGCAILYHNPAWVTLFTLLQEDEGQIEAAGGQEGRSEVCQLILQLSQLQHVLGQGVLQHIHVASLQDKIIEINDDIRIRTC